MIKTIITTFQPFNKLNFSITKWHCDSTMIQHVRTYNWFLQRVFFCFFEINHFVNVNKKIVKVYNASICHEIINCLLCFFDFHVFCFQFFFIQSSFYFLCCCVDDGCVNKKHYDAYIINNFHWILINLTSTRLLSVIIKKKVNSFWFFW